MPSFVYAPVLIILVYVSGSTINEIETSSLAIIQGTEGTFIRSSSQRETEVATATAPAPKLVVAQSLPSSSLPAMAIRERSMTAVALPWSISTSSTTPITRIISASSTASTSFPGDRVLSSSSPTPPWLGVARPTQPRVLTFKVLPTMDTRQDLATTTMEAMAAGAYRGGYLNVTSQSGTHAYLPCNVKQLMKKAVSWIRVRDGHILTVDQTTFIADQRFQSILSTNPEKWSLQIKYVQRRDAGWYECQVSTEPKISARVHLHVVEPRTEPFGEANRHVKAGSQVTLRCIVKGALEPPLFFNWFFDKKQIIFHNLNPSQQQSRNSWRSEIEKPSIVESNANDNKDTNSTANTDTVASLIIPSVTKKDSGNYTCSPSSSESITFVLHVLNGEYSASAITSRCAAMFQGNVLWFVVLATIQGAQFVLGRGCRLTFRTVANI